MKVLHITTSLRGGAGKAAMRLHEALLDRGIDSHILFKKYEIQKIRNGYQFKPSKRRFSKVLEKMGIQNSIEKQNLIKKKNAVNYYEFFSFASSSDDITESEHYQSATLINLHWIGDFFDLPLFLKKNTKPVVWSLSDMNSFSGGCHYSNGCAKYQTDCNTCPQLEGTVSNQNASKNLFQKLNALNSRKFDLIIVPPAPWLESCSRSSTMFKDLPHEVIPHASDEETYTVLDKTFCREVFNLPKDKIIFMFASENVTSKRKGFYLLKEALSILKNPDIHLLIVGTSNELIKKELSHLGNDNFSFTNFINDEKLLSIAYNAVSAMLIPSIEDNLPLTLIDSLLCGVPAVAFNVGGMKDHIIEGVNGHKAEYLSGASFANAINNFVLNMRSYDPQKVRAAALKLYAKPVHAAQYISLYKKLVKW